MARFTGTIGNPSVDASGNKIVKPIGEPIDIVFYAKGKAPIIRKTAADGKYDFTLANGSYQVSMYLSVLPEAFRIRADLRDGEFFVVATNSPVGAFQEWIDTAVDANKPEDNPIIKHIQGQLDAMQVILDQFRDETQQDGTGKFVKQSSVKRNSLKDGGLYYSVGMVPPKLEVGDSGLCIASSLLENNPGLDFSGLGITSAFIHYQIMANYQNSDSRLFAFFNGYGSSEIWVSSTDSRGVWVKPSRMYGTANTTVDSNGNIKAASPVINLFADHIEPNNHFSQEYEKKPIFEKIGIGCYKISSTQGLAKGEYAGDWNVEVPKDINGERYFNTEWEQLEDNTVIIRTYEREAFTEEYQRYDEDGNALTDTQGNVLKFYKRHEINGKPVDIKAGRFIALRFLEDEEAKAKREAEMEMEMEE